MKKRIHSVHVTKIGLLAYCALTLTLTGAAVSMAFSDQHHAAHSPRSDSMPMDSTESAKGTPASPDQRQADLMGTPAPGDTSSTTKNNAADCPNATPPASLPTFSGTPRIFHMGATDFFLDHPDHITSEQARALSAPIN